MVVGAKVCDLTEDLLWFVCSLYVGILTSSLRNTSKFTTESHKLLQGDVGELFLRFLWNVTKSHSYFL